MTLLLAQQMVAITPNWGVRSVPVTYSDSLDSAHNLTVSEDGLALFYGNAEVGVYGVKGGTQGFSLWEVPPSTGKTRRRVLPDRSFEYWFKKEGSPSLKNYEHVGVERILAATTPQDVLLQLYRPWAGGAKGLLTVARLSGTKFAGESLADSSQTEYIQCVVPLPGLNRYAFLSIVGSFVNLDRTRQTFKTGVLDGSIVRPVAKNDDPFRAYADKTIELGVEAETHSDILYNVPSGKVIQSLYDGSSGCFLKATSCDVRSGRRDTIYPPKGFSSMHFYAMNMRTFASALPIRRKASDKEPPAHLFELSMIDRSWTDLGPNLLSGWSASGSILFVKSSADNHKSWLVWLK